jgi:hypothetical protein
VTFTRSGKYPFQCDLPPFRLLKHYVQRNGQEIISIERVNSVSPPSMNFESIERQIIERGNSKKAHINKKNRNYGRKKKEKQTLAGRLGRLFRIRKIFFINVSNQLINVSEQDL